MWKDTLNLEARRADGGVQAGSQHPLGGAGCLVMRHRPQWPAVSWRRSPVADTDSGRLARVICFTEIDHEHISYTETAFPIDRYCHISLERCHYSTMSATNHATAVDALVDQVDDLCGLHDHSTRVIARLEIPQAAFSDRYPHSTKATFAFDSVVRMFLYQYTRGFTQSELYRRLKGAAYVWIRFELPRPPTQGTVQISKNARRSDNHIVLMSVSFE
jgi:hypothetical protein